jgi:Glyoxalase-like domain
MAVPYQLVIDCVGHPEPLARFWPEALGYMLEPPPADSATWDDWRRDVGLPEPWLGRGTRPARPANRLHIDVHASGGRDVPISARRCSAT